MKYLQILAVLLALTSCNLLTSDGSSTSSSSVSSESSTSSSVSSTFLPSTNGGTFNPGTGYTLVWSDEFNGNSIDTSVWSYETEATGWSHYWNNELQDYTDNGTGGPNAFITNGMLVIKAIKVNNNNDFGSYTSARMVTKGRKSWQYGVIAARIALPYGKGIWPAFWMLGNNYVWPASGEIDIMEQIGQESNKIYGTLHWDDGGHKYYGTSAYIQNPLEFHIYHAEWTTTYIKIGVDGNFYFNMDITGSGKTEFHQPFYILLNLAVGGNWPGKPDSTTKFPQYMFVDWVRVYQ